MNVPFPVEMDLGWIMVHLRGHQSFVWGVDTLFLRGSGCGGWSEAGSLRTGGGNHDTRGGCYRCIVQGERASER